MALQGLVE